MTPTERTAFDDLRIHAESRALRSNVDPATALAFAVDFAADWRMDPENAPDTGAAFDLWIAERAA